MHIFVTGASGFIGNQFIEELKTKLEKKDKVTVLSRKSQRFLDSRFECLIGNLENIDNFKEIILECEYVFHIAANATYGNKEDYEKTNYIPTKKITDILKKSKKLKNFIFVSTIGAVDRHKKDNCKEPINKDSIPSPQSKYGISKLKSENYITNNKIPYTIIRPTWVYGKNMRQKSHINLFVTLVNKKSIVTQINFPGMVSIIHVKDLAKSLVNCIDNKQVIKKVYFAQTQNISIGDIFNEIWKNLHKKESSRIPIIPVKKIIGKFHSKLPLSISNLFIDYLCVIDNEFKSDLLKNITPILFSKGIEDVISTNTHASGFWVITGANSGIGLALAKKLKKENKRLILIDKNTDNLKNKKIKKEFNRDIIINADISKKENIENIVLQIKKYPIFCLVNNAGIGYRKSFNDLSIEEINTIFAVNVTAHILITKLLLDKLKKEESTIVNIASSVAYNPLPNMSMYSSTKALISNWSESLSYELKKTNKVITFSPSGTNTNFQNSAGVKKEKNGKGLLTADYVAEKIIEAVNKNKTVVILGLKTKILLTISNFIPRKSNIFLWGKLFEKAR
jgi:hypothetical protein